jgi:DNA-binding transcriptional LysR family regulator
VELAAEWGGGRCGSGRPRSLGEWLRLTVEEILAVTVLVPILRELQAHYPRCGWSWT